MQTAPLYQNQIVVKSPNGRGVTTITMTDVNQPSPGWEEKLKALIAGLPARKESNDEQSN